MEEMTNVMTIGDHVADELDNITSFVENLSISIHDQ
jgi:hypothetical protein